MLKRPRLPILRGHLARVPEIRDRSAQPRAFSVSSSFNRFTWSGLARVGYAVHKPRDIDLAALADTIEQILNATARAEGAQTTDIR